MAVANVITTPKPQHVGYTRVVLDEVRNKIKASDAVLREARARRDLIRETAEHFPGTVRSFTSGSIAHGTVNHPLSDADGGAVLDGRQYPALGPDGGGIGPAEVVEQMRRFVREAVVHEYPDARCYVTKRAIKVVFNDPLEGQDPSADLVVALDRRDLPGLWIPNTEANRWDPSHPERHTQLAHDANGDTLRAWARIVRLGKANNGAYADAALCSFNVEALALESVQRGDIALNLLHYFEYAAEDLSRRNTPDPADVSAPIKLQVDRNVAVRRMVKAGEAVARALAHDSDEGIVREALAEVFPQQLALPDESPYLTRLEVELNQGSTGIRAGTVIGVLPGAVGHGVKSTRSHGGHSDGSA